MIDQKNTKRVLQITGDGSHTLYLPELAESYHSGNGAISESQYVFIQSGLHQLLNKTQISILEVGFGTGLNALLTCLEADKNQIHTTYFGLEPYPLSVKEAKALNYMDWLECNKTQLSFENLHSLPTNQWHVVTNYFTIQKCQQSLQAIDFKDSYDLVYFDAFAPSRQPELWNKELFQKIALQMPTGGILVTYSAKGQVRRDLIDCGFNVERMDGPPGKREMLRAIKEQKW